MNAVENNNRSLKVAAIVRKKIYDLNEDIPFYQNASIFLDTFRYDDSAVDRGRLELEMTHQ